MSRDEQIEKVSKQRREYLKFKPFADDLRKAESWCELDGVLNRYQTVKNLSKMGHRKSTDLAEEIFAGIEAEIAKCFKECFKWEGNTTERREMLNFNARIKMSLGELKEKYTEGGKEQDG